MGILREISFETCIYIRNVYFSAVTINIIFTFDR